MVATSQKIQMWGTQITWSDPAGNQVADTSISGTGKLKQAFCGGGDWVIAMSPGVSQDLRQAIVSLVAVKGVRDSDRDDEGKVSGSVCHDMYWGAIIGETATFLKVF